MKSHLVFFLLLWSCTGMAQSLFTIRGTVRSAEGQPLENVTVTVSESAVNVKTDSTGSYSVLLPPRANYLIRYSLPGFATHTEEVKPVKRAIITRDILLRKNVNQLDQVEVNADNYRQGNLSAMSGDMIRNLPSASGNFESALKLMPGVSANNELSAQYSVRGGNFDENLIYINDIEIFKPLLIRNGQQEGLSFINPALVSSASFSGGGFQARYGDKLSSVLDVKYGRPDSNQINLNAGLLGFSASLRMLGKSGYTLAGFRNKTNQGILNKQPVAGSYQPRFYDFQLLHESRLAKNFSMSVMTIYNISRFTLIPENRETSFGTIDQQLRLSVDYEGMEKDRYTAGAGALSFSWTPSEKFRVKWINSAFAVREQETFDIEGSYVFGELQTAGDGTITTSRGIGKELNYGRNNLNADVYSTELKVYVQKKRSFWEAGLRFQADRIKDDLNEYAVIDSAGYTLPQGQDNLYFNDAVSARNLVKTRRVMAYVQNTFTVSDELTVSAGLRSNFSSFTQEFLLSPRISAAFHPDGGNVTWRLSGGVYDQPPFYRELRNFDGSLNLQSKAQRSLHLLGGADYSFRAFGTGMKFISELYYKKLDGLIPYKIDNLRIRYFADQKSDGYTAGADFSLSGEFVGGLESLVRLSFMKAGENIRDDFYYTTDAAGNPIRVEPGYLKRPTDQRINFSAFFQDKLFNSPSNKVHLTLLYGSALPAGPPRTARYNDVFKIPAYKRADIGFSKDFMEGRSSRTFGFLYRNFSSVIIQAEVFNLFDINNTVSYLWLKDVNNIQYAIPNYLTSRQLNIKISATLGRSR